MSALKPSPINRPAEEQHTGTYKVVNGKLTRVSRKAGPRRFLSVTCPPGGYDSEHLGCFVESRTHKRRLLDERGLEEAG